MRNVAVALIVIGCVCVASASAGPLATDPYAFVDDEGTVWRGTTSMADDYGILAGDVDWCVYAPGDFAQTGYTGYTADSDEFVYAYELYNVGSAGIERLSVKMLDSNEANDLGTFSLTGVDPTSMFWGGTAPSLDTANWSWSDLSNYLDAGQNSVGLAYSSVNMPLMYDCYLHNGGSTAASEVSQGDPGIASPSDVIPEPATLGLLAIGGLAAVLRRRR